MDELRKLLSDKDAYQQFLLSLDQVKVQNNVRTVICGSKNVASSYILRLFTGAHCFGFCPQDQRGAPQRNIAAS